MSTAKYIRVFPVIEVTLLLTFHYYLRVHLNAIAWGQVVRVCRKLSYVYVTVILLKNGCCMWGMGVKGACYIVWWFLYKWIRVGSTLPFCVSIVISIYRFVCLCENGYTYFRGKTFEMCSYIYFLFIYIL